jgi:hypothetical protein
METTRMDLQAAILYLKGCAIQRGNCQWLFHEPVNSYRIIATGWIIDGQAKLSFQPDASSDPLLFEGDEVRDFLTGLK